MTEHKYTMQEPPRQVDGETWTVTTLPSEGVRRCDACGMRIEGHAVLKLEGWPGDPQSRIVGIAHVPAECWRGA